MPFVNIRQRTVSFTPANHQTTATTALFNMAAGELVVAAFVRITTAFDGSGTNAALDLGDDGDINRFIENVDITETTAGIYQGSGAGLADDFGFLYTANNTIDVVFTRDTGVNGTVGSADFIIYYVQVEPR